MNKSKAIGILKSLGFQMDPEVTGKFGDTWMCTYDPIGRMSISGDCRGTACWSLKASDLWDEVVELASTEAKYLEPCPHDIGKCYFHDVEEN